MLRTGLGALAVGLLALPSAAWGAWSAPESVTPPGVEARFPAVASNASGQAVAAWIVRQGRRTRVQAALGTTTGGWSRPRTLSGRSGAARDPRVAIDARGRIVLAWRRVARTRTVISRGRRLRQAVYVVEVVRRRWDGPRWGTARRLSDDAQKAGPPAVGVDAIGRPTVVWHWGSGTAPRSAGFVSQVQLATVESGSAFARTRRVSGSRGCAAGAGRPGVATGATRISIAWWDCRPTTSGGVPALVVRSAGMRRFGVERRSFALQRGGGIVALGVAGSGAALGLIERRPSPSARPSRLLWFAVRGGRIAGPRTLVDARGRRVSGERAALGVAPDGAALAAWVGAGSVDGSWGRTGRTAQLGAAATISAREDAPGSPALAIDDDAALLVWVRAGAGARLASPARGAVRVARASTSGRTWEPAQTISARGAIDVQGPPQVALGAGGAVAYWARRSGGRFTVERAHLRPGRGAT